MVGHTAQNMLADNTADLIQSDRSQYSYGCDDDTIQ